MTDTLGALGATGTVVASLPHMGGHGQRFTTRPRYHSIHTRPRYHSILFEIVISYTSIMGMLWLKNTITEKIKQIHFRRNTLPKKSAKGPARHSHISHMYTFKNPQNQTTLKSLVYHILYYSQIRKEFALRIDWIRHLIYSISSDKALI